MEVTPPSEAPLTIMRLPANSFSSLTSALLKLLFCLLFLGLLWLRLLLLTRLVGAWLLRLLLPPLLTTRVLIAPRSLIRLCDV